MMVNLGKKILFVIFVQRLQFSRTCVVRDGPLFFQGYVYEGRVWAFSKTKFVHSKTRKSAEKQGQPWGKIEQVLSTIINSFSMLKTFLYKLLRTKQNHAQFEGHAPENCSNPLPSKK